jgi:hypothetical protein
MEEFHGEGESVIKPGRMAAKPGGENPGQEDYSISVPSFGHPPLTKPFRQTQGHESLDILGTLSLSKGMPYGGAGGEFNLN